MRFIQLQPNYMHIKINVWHGHKVCMKCCVEKCECECVWGRYVASQLEIFSLLLVASRQMAMASNHWQQQQLHLKLWNKFEFIYSLTQFICSLSLSPTHTLSFIHSLASFWRLSITRVSHDTYVQYVETKVSLMLASKFIYLINLYGALWKPWYTNVI